MMNLINPNNQNTNGVQNNFQSQSSVSNSKNSSNNSNNTPSDDVDMDFFYNYVNKASAENNMMEKFNDNFDVRNDMYTSGKHQMDESGSGMKNMENCSQLWQSNNQEGAGYKSKSKTDLINKKPSKRLY
jgi:hypothetical protein